MEALWAAGAKVQAYDPEAMEEAQRIYGDREDLLLVGTKEAALKGADALVILTEWQAFRAPDFELHRRAAQGAGDLRRPQPLRPRAHGAAQVHLLRHRARRRHPGGVMPGSMKILVTGNAGFIGFHVARALIARGDAVVGIDAVNDYYDPALKEARLAELERAAAETGEPLRVPPRRPRRPGRRGGRLRRPPLRPGDQPRRPGRGALFPGEPARLRAVERRRLHPRPRGLPPGAGGASHLRLDLERLWRQQQHALHRGPGGRPSLAVLRRHQAGERADGACLQPPLPAADHRLALLHRLRPLGAAGHGADALRLAPSSKAGRSRSTATGRRAATSPISTTSSRG